MKSEATSYACDNATFLHDMLFICRDRMTRWRIQDSSLNLDTGISWGPRSINLTMSSLKMSFASVVPVEGQATCNSWTCAVLQFTFNQHINTSASDGLYTAHTIPRLSNFTAAHGTMSSFHQYIRCCYGNIYHSGLYIQWRHQVNPLSVCHH